MSCHIKRTDVAYVLEPDSEVIGGDMGVLVPDMD